MTTRKSRPQVRSSPSDEASSLSSVSSRVERDGSTSSYTCFGFWSVSGAFVGFDPCLFGIRGESVVAMGDRLPTLFPHPVSLCGNFVEHGVRNLSPYKLQGIKWLTRTSVPRQPAPITSVSGARLKSITVNTAAASAVLTVYDTTLVTGAGGPVPANAAVIAVVDCSVVGTKVYDTGVINGVSVVLSGANADLTIVTQ